MIKSNMLNQGQINHYRTFGYLRVPGLVRPELDDIIAEADAIWSSDDTPEKNRERRLGYFIERSERLTNLVIDTCPIIEQLLGPDIVWVGSEGNISARDRVNWHADRKYYRSGEEQLIDFHQIKLMMYLEPVTRDTGCLRVIPGSHRMPLHKELGDQERDASSMPFGVDGPDLPSHALESDPGDGILFNHCTWHAAYGGGPDRRYVAMKFAVRPENDNQWTSLERYTPNVLKPHPNFLGHPHDRISRLIDPLVQRASRHTDAVST